MYLHLLRHAEAAVFHPDPDRPLTAKGQSDSEALGRLLARQGRSLPATIWCSPYLRARQTADAVLRGFGEEANAFEVRDGLTPYDDPADLLGELAELEEDLLIVGHNPHMAVLAGYLLGGLAGNVSVRYRKATLMRFERIKRYSNEQAPAWVLNWMLTPQLYRQD